MLCQPIYECEWREEIADCDEDKVIEVHVDSSSFEIKSLQIFMIIE